MRHRLMYETYNPTNRSFSYNEPPTRIVQMEIITLGGPKNILYSLVHKLPFASDTEINDMLYQEYHRTYGVYNTPQEMIDELNAHITLNRPYWEHLYRTTLYTYNPIENYRMVEEEDESTCGERRNQTTNQSQVDTNTTGKQFGYNEATPSDTQREVGRSASVGGTGSNDKTRTKGKRKLTRSGNIGVTTSQQMIQSERDLIISIIRKYVESFRPFFIIC